MLEVSQAAIDLIVDEEIGSKALYDRKYHRPEVPPVPSGVTVGIGYDLGYETATQVRNDWDGTLPANVVAAMITVVGKRGNAAKMSLPSVYNIIDVPWDAAMAVFEKKDVPRYLDMLTRAVQNCDKLAPDCLGALLSITYNRGSGGFNSSDPRFREMRQIRDAMDAERFSKIPDLIRSMKRLWNNGLVGRREREAKLFERGLLIMGGTESEATAPRVQTRQQEVQRKATLAGAAVGVGGGIGGTVAPSKEPVTDNMPYIAGGALVAVILTVGVILYINRHFKLPRAD